MWSSKYYVIIKEIVQLGSLKEIFFYIVSVYYYSHEDFLVCIISVFLTSFLFFDTFLKLIIVISSYKKFIVHVKFYTHNFLIYEVLNKPTVIHYYVNE